MSYLTKLKSLDSEKRLPSEPQKPQKPPFYSFCGTQDARFQKSRPVNDAESGRHERWRVTYPDRVTEVWIDPPVTRDEALASRPDAISAEPVQPMPEPAYPPRLDPEIEHRVMRMGARWQYSPDELAVVLRRAARNPDAWRAVIEADEALNERRGSPWSLKSD